MQHHRPALSWHRRLTNRRGAAFLLSVYFVSLLLLVLGGISLQRTTIESRASQISRDQAQAFYLAEAALDSALVRLKRETLLDAISYSTAQEGAAFRLETVAGEVFPPPVERERLTRRIVATGVIGTSARAQVSAAFTEEGPLEGVWGRKLAVAHGGRLWHSNASRNFLLGSLRSQHGSIASTVDFTDTYGVLNPAGNPWYFAGLAKGDPALSSAQNYAALEGRVMSRELQSLKRGYRYLKQTGVENTAEIQYSDGPRTATIPHVSGGVSSGTVTNIPTVPLPFPFSMPIIAQTLCREPLQLKDPVTVIDAKPFSEPVVSDTNIRNFGGSEHITLCVNAVVPATNEAFLDALLGGLPEVVFRKPTTLYVVGSQSYDISALHFTVDLFGGGSGWTTIVQVVPAFPDRGIQTDWNVSIGAKISVADQFGQPIPGGLKIVMAKTPVSMSLPEGQSQSPGLVWVQPGNGFSGSIYAPDSLVVLRERAYEDRGAKDAASAAYYGEMWQRALDGDCNDPECQAAVDNAFGYGEIEYEPMQLQYVVGNEAVVEMWDDRVQFAPDASAQRTVTQPTGWVDESETVSASATSTP